MRPVKIALVLAFSILLPLPAAGQEPIFGPEPFFGAERRLMLDRIASAASARDFPSAIAHAQILIKGPYVRPLDFALLASLHDENGDDPLIVEAWYRKAATALPEHVELRLEHCRSQLSAGLFQEALVSLREIASKPGFADQSGKIQTFLGDAYQGLGQKKEALCAWTRALLHDPSEPAFWANFRPPYELPVDAEETLGACGIGNATLVARVLSQRHPRTWKEPQLDAVVGAFVELAAALESSGNQICAERFRVVAAHPVVWQALLEIRRGNVARSLELFALGEHAAPLSSLPTALQVSALRDMTVAFGRSGRLAQAVAAFERLVDLCLKLDQEGGGCPVEGDIVPMFMDRLKKDIVNSPPGWQINVFHASLLLQRLVSSVSFDPLTGLPRYQDGHDFVGSDVDHHGGAGGGTLSYGATTPEEDRTTLQTEDPSKYRERALNDARRGRYELLVKKWIADWCFRLRFGDLPAGKPSGEVLGFPLSELFTVMERSPKGEIPEPTRQALLLAGRVVDKLSAIPRSAPVGPGL